MVEQHQKQRFIRLTKEQKAARKNRAMGILIAVLVFSVLIYIATYAKFGA